MPSMTIHGRTDRDVRLEIVKRLAANCSLYEMSKRHLNIRAHISARINIQISVFESGLSDRNETCVFIIHLRIRTKAVKLGKLVLC